MYRFLIIFINLCQRNEKKETDNCFCQEYTHDDIPKNVNNKKDLTCFVLLCTDCNSLSVLDLVVVVVVFVCILDKVRHVSSLVLFNDGFLH